MKPNPKMKKNIQVFNDIPTFECLEKIVKTAKENPQTNYLAFTKFHKLVDYLNNYGELPNNLCISAEYHSRKQVTFAYH